VLDDYGLVAALGWYANQWTDRTRVPVEVAGEECDPRLPRVTENALFRIAQEALNNIAKHAGASHVTIAVAADPSGVHLTIADDGKGFSAAAPAPPDDRSHWGLRIMQERAEGVGGVCRCESRLGEGTRVSVQVPR
jgi:signal transduction histidine kinase